MRNDRNIIQEGSVRGKFVLSFISILKKTPDSVASEKYQEGTETNGGGKRNVNMILSYFLKGEYVCV